MQKSDLVIACMLAANPSATLVEANAFAAQVWKDRFSNHDFAVWNTKVPQEVADRLIAEAERQRSFELEHLIAFLT